MKDAITRVCVLNQNHRTDMMRAKKHACIDGDYS